MWLTDPPTRWMAKWCMVSTAPCTGPQNCRIDTIPFTTRWCKRSLNPALVSFALVCSYVTMSVVLFHSYWCFSVLFWIVIMLSSVGFFAPVTRIGSEPLQKDCCLSSGMLNSTQLISVRQ